jgi:nitrite reductase/ring-hydroxylating ferredoxin subunit
MAARNLNRREVLALGAAGLVGTGVAVGVAGCSPTSSGSTSGSGELASGTELIATSAVAVGASVNVTSGSTLLVISQPTAGNFVALSAICTHEGCVVAPRDAQLYCACHGAKFNPTTGAVLAGPAKKPLGTIAITVRDGKIFTA